MRDRYIKVLLRFAVPAVLAIVLTGCPNPVDPVDDADTPTYTITFNANGGDGTMDSITAEDGTTIDLPENTFTRSPNVIFPYEFRGWATSSTGPIEYENEEIFTLGSSDVELFARWTMVINSSITQSNLNSTEFEIEEGSFVRVVPNRRVDIALTINPGTTIEFEENARLLVSGSSASLTAVGTSEDPILFTGTEATPGWWQNITIGSDNSANRLEHVIIEYGGRDDNPSLRIPASGTSLPGQLYLIDSTIRDSAGLGVELFGPAKIPEWTRNTITGNADAPVQLRPEHVHLLDAESAYSGNVTDAVLVRGRSTYQSSFIGVGTVTWPALDVPYRFSMQTTVRDGSLTIAPGAILEFEEDAVLTLDRDQIFIAEGTEEAPIVFTGTEPIPGWWRGVRVNTSNSLLSNMEHVVIEYGGRDERANLMVGQQFVAGRIRISDSTIRNSSHYGIWQLKEGTVVASNIEYENNAEGNFVVDD